MSCLNPVADQIRTALSASPRVDADVMAAAELAVGGWAYQVADRAGDRRTEVIRLTWRLEDALDFDQAAVATSLAALNLVAAQVLR